MCLYIFFCSYYIFTIYMSIFFVFNRSTLHCYCFPSQTTQSVLDIDSKTYFSFAAVYSALLWKVVDPDFIPLTHECPSDMGPSAKRKCVRTAVEELEDEDDDNEEVEDKDQPAPQAKGPTKKGKPASRLTWKKVDLDNQALPEYQHVPPYSLRLHQQVLQPTCQQAYSIANQLECNTEVRQHHLHHH